MDVNGHVNGRQWTSMDVNGDINGRQWASMETSMDVNGRQWGRQWTSMGVNGCQWRPQWTSMDVSGSCPTTEKVSIKSHLSYLIHGPALVLATALRTVLGETLAHSPTVGVAPCGMSSGLRNTPLSLARM